MIILLKVKKSPLYKKCVKDKWMKWVKKMFFWKAFKQYVIYVKSDFQQSVN